MATKTDLDERTDDPMPDAIGTPSKEINKDRAENAEEGSDIDKDEAQRRELDESEAGL